MKEGQEHKKKESSPPSSFSSSYSLARLGLLWLGCQREPLKKAEPVWCVFLYLYVDECARRYPPFHLVSPFFSFFPLLLLLSFFNSPLLCCALCSLCAMIHSHGRPLHSGRLIQTVGCCLATLFRITRCHVLRTIGMINNSTQRPINKQVWSFASQLSRPPSPSIWMFIRKCPEMCVWSLLPTPSRKTSIQFPIIQRGIHHCATRWNQQTCRVHVTFGRLFQYYRQFIC